MLLITKEDISFEGKLYSINDGQLNLGYVEDYSGKKNVRLIGGIEPIHLSKEDGLGVVKAIKASMTGQQRNQVLNEIFTEFYFLYGKPDKRDIEKLYLTTK